MNANEEKLVPPMSPNMSNHSGAVTPGMLADRAQKRSQQGYKGNKPQASIEQAGQQQGFGQYTYAVEEIEDQVPEKVYR